MRRGLRRPFWVGTGVVAACLVAALAVDEITRKRVRPAPSPEVALVSPMVSEIPPSAEGSRRHEVPSVGLAAADPDDAARAAIESCRDAAASDFVACLSAASVDWGAVFHAKFLCDVLGDATFVHRAPFLRFAVERLQPGTALSKLAAVDGACAELVWSSDSFSEALLDIRQQNGAWWTAFTESIGLSDLAGSSSTSFGARLVGLLACGGASEFTELVDSVALGQGDATFEQMREGIMFSMLRRTDPVDVLRFADDLLASPGFARTPRAAEILTRTLLSSSAWPDGNAGPALDTVDRLLLSPEFCRATALHILVNTSDRPPGRCDPDRWTRLRHRCEELAREAGWVYR